MLSAIVKSLSAKAFGIYQTGPEHQEKLLQQFADSMGVSEGYKAAEAFNDLTKNHMASIEALAEQEQQAQADANDKDKQKPQKGEFTKLHEKIEAKLKDNDQDAVTVNEALKKALTLTDQTHKAQQEYNTSIAAVNNMIKDPSAAYNVTALASYLHETKNAAVAAIKNQHSKELDELKTIFTDNTDIIDALKSTLDIDSSQVEDFQKKLTDTLSQTHKKQLTEFEKSTDESIQDMHTEAQKERDKIAFIAMQYQNNKQTKKKIENAMAQRQANDAAINIDVDANTKKITLKGINVDDLPIIETITGRKIEKLPNNEFKINLPNRLISSPKNWLYHSSLRTARQADLMSLAQAIKACGYETIEMNIEGVTPEQAKKLIMESYAACLKSGFSPENITIKYNGQDMIAMGNDNNIKIENFIKQDSMYPSIEAEAAIFAEDRARFNEEYQNKKPTQKATQELKKTLSEYRKEGEIGGSQLDDTNASQAKLTK